MKKCLIFAVVCAVAGFTGGAQAFEPISTIDTPSHFGKPVYPSTSMKKRGKTKDVVILAGEPLTLVSCKTSRGTVTHPDGKKLSGEHYNLCDVTNADGETVTLGLGELSKSPLLFNLKQPGTAQELIVAVFKDGYPLAEKMHAIQVKNNYVMETTMGMVEKDGKTFMGDEYYQVQAMKKALEFEERLVRELFQGSRVRKDSIMRDPLMKWAALATDATLLEWYSEGIPEGPLKKKYEPLKDGLTQLSYVYSADRSMADLKEKAAAKPWRRGLKDMPEDKLKKLDAEEMTKLEKEMKQLEKRIDDHFAAGRAALPASPSAAAASAGKGKGKDKDKGKGKKAKGVK
jgi:hypothetical protein